MQQILSRRYSAEVEGMAGHEIQTSMSGLFLVLGVVIFSVLVAWAGVEAPDLFAASMISGVEPL